MGERQLTLFEIKGKFTKDFDTFGKMDPFAQFSVGQYSMKTQTLQGAGKQAAWTTRITLIYYDQSAIQVIAYDEDASQNQLIGSGKIDISTLKGDKGTFEIKILGKENQDFGTLSGKYQIMPVQFSPLLFIKNIKCEFLKQHAILLDTKPFIQATSQQGKSCTETKQNGKGLQFSYDDKLRLRLRNEYTVSIAMIDKIKNTNIFVYDSYAMEYKSQKGSKKYFVLDEGYRKLGFITFDFETTNYVSKQQFFEMEKIKKPQHEELTSITLQKIKLNLPVEKKNIYFKFLIGANEQSTGVTENATDTHQIKLQKKISSDGSSSKLLVLIFQNNTVLKDSVLAVGVVNLTKIRNGQNIVQFYKPNSNTARLGKASLFLTSKKAPLKILKLKNISVEVQESADLIGESQIYIVGKLNGWSDQTQVGNGQKILFKKQIELKFSQQSTLQLQVYDEDVTKDKLIYKNELKFDIFKADKGKFQSNLTEEVKPGQFIKKGIIKAVFQVIKPKSEAVVSKPQTPKKSQPKKEAIKKQAPKEQIKKKEQPTKEVAQQQSPKKEVLKKQTIKQQTPRQKPVQSQQPVPKKQQKTHTQNLDHSKATQKPSIQDSSTRKIILPLIQNSKRNYGDEIYDIQSSATLQKSIHAYSMPKEPRFRSKPIPEGEPSYNIESSFKLNISKGVGIGYGNKSQFPKWMQKNMKEIPAPGSYEVIPSKTAERMRGPTFGISHKYYQKVLIPKNQIKPSQTPMVIRKKI